MGYHVDQFVDENIDDEFLCAICHDVLRDPKLVKPCEHVFCNECIEQWCQQSGQAVSTCPIDRKEIRSLKEPQRMCLKLLNKLEVRCPFKVHGCRATLTLGDLPGHEKGCDFYMQTCANDCGADLKRSEVAGHNCVKYLKERLKATCLELEKSRAENVEPFFELALGATRAEPTVAQEEPPHGPTQNNGTPYPATIKLAVHGDLGGARDELHIIKNIFERLISRFPTRADYQKLARELDHGLKKAKPSSRWVVYTNSGGPSLFSTYVECYPWEANVKGHVWLTVRDFDLMIYHM